MTSIVLILVPDVEVGVGVICSQEQSSLYLLTSLLLSEGQNFHCLLNVSYSVGDRQAALSLPKRKV